MLLSYEDWLLENSKHLCWEDRLLHVNSKVRYAGNIDLKLLCDSITDPKDHRIGELGPLFKDTVSDSDVAVLDKVLDALIAYLKAADADVAGSYAKEICDAILANCLTDRPETVNKAQIVFMLLVKLEAVDALLPSEMNQLKNAELLKETKRLQKMSLSDSQEQNKKKKQHHYDSEKGYRHYVKSKWPGYNFLSAEKVKETLMEELKEELEWIKSHECTRCGLIYDMSCVCQQELELDFDEIRLFNYGSYLKRAKSAVSDGGGKDQNADIWSPPWDDPCYAY